MTKLVMEIETDVRAEVAEITPEFAKTILQNNKRNRNLSAKTVQSYIWELERDRWQLNGATIVLAKNGVLIDGQHRLVACAKSGIPFLSILVTGVDPSAVRTLDRGKKRTDADFLRMQNVYSSIQVAPTFSQAMAYRSGTLNSRGFNLLLLINRNESARELFSRVGFSSIEDSVKIGRKYDKEAIDTLLPATRLAALHLLLISEGITSFDFASGFIKKLATGVNCRPTDPVFHALNFCRMCRLRDIALTASQRMLIMINAWNKFVKGDEMKKQTPKLLNKFNFMPLTKINTKKVELYLDQDDCLQRRIL